VPHDAALGRVGGWTAQRRRERKGVVPIPTGAARVRAPTAAAVHCLGWSHERRRQDMRSGEVEPCAQKRRWDLLLQESDPIYLTQHDPGLPANLQNFAIPIKLN